MLSVDEFILIEVYFQVIGSIFAIAKSLFSGKSLFIMKHTFTRFLFIALAFFAPLIGWGQTNAGYKVNSTTAVTTSGNIPSGSSAFYSQTYNTARQITGGNSATLKLAGYGGNTISKITLSMRSNSSSGSGTLSVTAGATTISSISTAVGFNNAAWYGAWSANYVPIVKTPTAYTIQSGDTVTIKISATSNSLYIDSFGIEYSPVITCTGPTDSASVFSATAIATNAATLGWTAGNGTARVAFLKAGAFTAANPITDSAYAANASFTATGSTAFDGGGKTVYNSSGNTVTVTDLTPNTLYNAKVYEYLTNAGVECYNTKALPGNFTTISNPATATAASAIGANGFTANWTAPTGNGSAALTYTLEVATDNAFSNIIQTIPGISSVNINFSVTSLSPATTYYYRVTAVNSGGASALSNAIFVTTASAMPPAFTSTQNCGSVTLNAYTGPDASTYYWQTDPMNPNTNFPATQPYVVTASGQYSVQAYANGLWSSANSANIIVPNNPTITTQPSNTSVGAGSTATFTVVANNAGSYQWQVNDGYGFVNLSNNAQYSGVSTATLTVSNTTLFMDYYQYRVVVKAAAPCTVDVNSTSATLNVTPVSNATDYFRSRTTGLYGNASTWESSADSITWINATSAPTDAAKSVTIRVNDSVTVATSGRSAAHLYVFGKLTLSGQNLAIADSSGYDVVIFNGGQLDCGTLNVGNELSLPSSATVLIRTGGRIITRVSNALAGPGRNNKYFYENESVLEYAGTQAITNSGAVYFPNGQVGTTARFIFSKFPAATTINGNSPITFNGRVEFTDGAGVTWAGTGQKIFRDGLVNNGDVNFNSNTPFVISGINAILEGVGTITIGNTAGMSIAAGANVQMMSDITINGTGTITVSGTLNTNGHKISGTAKFATAAGSTLIVTDAAGLTGSGTSGNIQTTGTRTFSTSGNYIYRGTAAQATGDGLTGSATLEIDNAAGVTLSAAHTATTGLTLTSGNLTTTTTNLLTLGSAAVLTGGSATAFVAGPLKRATAAATDFLFPIGKPGDYAPVTITPQTATASDYTAEYFNGAQLTPNRGNKAASLKYVAANEYFDISRGTGADAKVTLTYTTAAQVTDPSTLVVAHYTGGQWVSEGGTATGNNNSGTVISGNFVSSFSPFALGSTSAAQPLPLQLLSFSARPAARAALLDWELATPDGGEQIVVERSNDGSDFTALGRFDLTKETPLRQRFTDESPLTGPNYYRLRITGVDGVVTHSPVRTLHFGAVATSDLRLYPNPAHDVLNLEWTSTEAPAHIQLFTSAGRLVLSEKVVDKANASLSVSGLVPGVYWVVLEQAGKTERRQVHIGH